MATFDEYNAQLNAIKKQLEDFDRIGYLPGAPGYSRAQLVDDMIRVATERNKAFPNYAANKPKSTIGSGSSTSNSFDRAEARRFENIRNNPSTTNRTTTPIRPDSAGITGQAYTDGVDIIAGSVIEYEDARDGARAILDKFGALGSLTDMVTLFIMDKGEDYTQDDVMSYIRSSDAYKRRFAGIEARRKVNPNAPLPSEIEYLATEEQYRKAMSQYLPKGFYDTPQDFVKFFAADLSPDEVGTRAKTAYALSQKANKDARTALKDYYGIGDKEIAAYFLDPSRATPLLTERANAAIVGGNALRSGLEVKRTYAETLAQEGYTAETRDAFAETATSLGTTNLLASLGGERVSVADVTDAALNRNVKATRKIEGLRSQQRARFGGSSAGTNIIGKDTLGSF